MDDPGTCHLVGCPGKGTMDKHRVRAEARRTREILAKALPRRPAQSPVVCVNLQIVVRAAAALTSMAKTSPSRSTREEAAILVKALNEARIT